MLPMINARNLAGLCVLIALGFASVSVAGGQGLFTQEFSLAEYVAANGIALDASGVYVFGSQDAFLRKFDHAGKVLWTRTLGRGSNNNLRALAMAMSNGRIYLLMSRSTRLGEIDLRAFDTGGRDLWTRPMDNAKALAADSGGIYVVGGGNSREDAGFVSRYDPDGNQIWTRSVHNQAASGRGDAIAVDQMGIYLAGIARLTPGDSGELVTFLQKRSKDGDEVWTRHQVLSRHIALLASDASGIYAVGPIESGTSYLDRFDGEGNLLWSRGIGAPIYGITADADGLYVAGSAYAPFPDSCMAGYYDWFVRKFNTEGELRWTRQFSPGVGTDFGYAYGLATDATSLYIAGSLVAGSRAALLAKIDKDQAEIRRSGPWIASGCVVNAANYRGGQISPGEIVTIRGRDIGPSEGVIGSLSESGHFPVSLGETRVLFDGAAVELLYASANQINAIVPDSVTGQSYINVEVENRGVRSNAMTMPVTAVRPGVFTADGSGTGPLLVINQDGSLNSRDNQAEKGSIITLYATGFRLSDSLNAYFCCYSDAITPAPIIGVAPGPIPGLFLIKVRILDRLAVNDLVVQDSGVWLQLSVGGRNAIAQDNYVFVRDAYRP